MDCVEKKANEINETMWYDVNWLFVGAGGAAGAVFRFLLSRFVSQKSNTTFPVGTFIVNISGALLLGGTLVLLANLTGASNDALGSNPTPRTAASVANGSALFQINCTSCHGDDARGDGPLAPTLSRPPADLHAAHVDDHADADMAWWIMNGIQPVMPAFGDQLTPEQVWDLVNYVRSLRQGLEE